MSESFSPSRVEKAACSIGNEARSRIGNKECRSKRKGEKSGRIVNRKPTTMFVAWLKPPWQQITPYIADRRFCAPKMKRNGAKKGRKGGRAKVEKKMTARRGTAGRRGCAEKELEGVAMRWGRGDGFSAVRPHAALNHARTFFTFRSFNGAPFEGLPLWGWRRDFSRSPSANSRNTTNGSFHPYLRRLSSGSASLFLLLLLPPPPPPRIELFPDYFYAIHWVHWQLLLESRFRFSRFSVSAVPLLGQVVCIVVSWNCFRIEFTDRWKSRILTGSTSEC